MARNIPIFLISQGDGLKSHLSTDPDGDLALCGRKIKHYGKSVRNLKEIDLLSPFNICKKCLKILGLDDEV